MQLAEEILAVYAARVVWDGAAVTATVGAGLDRVRKGTDFIPSRPERGMAPYGVPNM